MAETPPTECWGPLTEVRTWAALDAAALDDESLEQPAVAPTASRASGPAARGLHVCRVAHPGDRQIPRVG